MGGAAIPLILGGAGAAYSAYAQHEQGQFNKQVNEIMAQDAVSRSEFPQSVTKARGTQVISGVSAAAAGAGLDVSRGSPVDVAGGTRMMSALDVAMIRANALREAYGYRVRGSIAEAESDNTARATLISGVTNFIGGGYKAGLPLFSRS